MSRSGSARAAGSTLSRRGSRQRRRPARAICREGRSRQRPAVPPVQAASRVQAARSSAGAAVDAEPGSVSSVPPSHTVAEIGEAPPAAPRRRPRPRGGLLLALVVLAIAIVAVVLV